MCKSARHLYASFMFRRLFSHIGYSNLTIRFQGYNIFEKLNKYFFKRSGFKASGQLLSIAATTVIELKIHFLPKISQKIAVKFSGLHYRDPACQQRLEKIGVSLSGPLRLSLRTEYLQKSRKIHFQNKKLL
jgi:hypothetical protein